MSNKLQLASPQYDVHRDGHRLSHAATLLNQVCPVLRLLESIPLSALDNEQQKDVQKGYFLISDRLVGAMEAAIESIDSLAVKHAWEALEQGLDSKPN